MHNREAFDKTYQRGFGGRGEGCREHFRSRFGEAFGGGFKGGPWGDGFRRRMAGRKSVNIEEAPDHYLLSLYAAGLKKELFSISVSDDILTVSYQPQAEETPSNFIYEEYRPVQFKRSFQLNGKVLTDQITASYTDGVLGVILPKNPEAQSPAQEIRVD